MIELRKLAEKDAEFMLEWMHNYRIARAKKRIWNIIRLQHSNMLITLHRGSI